jgi:DNA-binding GntR family transcriptional regulator
MRNILRSSVRNREGETHLSSHAYERIRAEIAEGRLPPSVVIREVDLVKQYAMSRTPIREALHRLNGEGLIRRTAPGGYVAVELGPKELSDIYQVREVLVGLAAELAARNRSRVDIAHLEDALDAIDRACAVEAGDEADQHVRAFFHTIASASGNDYLRATLGRLNDFFRYKALAVTHPEWRDALRAQHLRLKDAIAEQNDELAGRLGRELIAQSLAIRIEGLRKAAKRERPGA